MKPQRALSNTLGEIAIPKGLFFNSTLCVCSQERGKEVKAQLMEGTGGYLKDVLTTYYLAVLCELCGLVLRLR